MFLVHLRSFGKDWARIQTYIQTKTHAQIRNFYQNYKYKLDLPGILQQRENDLAKKKKKEEKEAKKGKRKYKDILNEHKRQKKSQKQLEADKSRRQQQKAKRQRVDKNSESSPANGSGSTPTSSTGKSRSPPNSSLGINGPRPASIKVPSSNLRQGANSGAQTQEVL